MSSMLSWKERLRRVVLGGLYAIAGASAVMIIHAANSGDAGWALVFGGVSILASFVASGGHKL